MALVCGPKVVNEVIQNQNLEKVAVLYPEMASPDIHPEIKSIQLEKSLFKELDLIGTNSPLLIIKLKNPTVWRPSETQKGLNVFLPMQDPNNLGAAIRACVAFNAKKIVLLEEACNPFHPKVTRAASGANLFAPIEVGPSINNLTGNYISLNKDGHSISSFQWPETCNLLIGEEGKGVPEMLKQQCLCIPISDSVESLNAYSSLSIALYDYQSKRI